MIWGAMSSAGVGNVTAPVYQEILEHFMLPSADQLFKDADFIFQQDLVPAHTAKNTNQKLVKWPWCWCAWLASKLTRPGLHRESMGYCQEENEKQETKKCRWAEGHCQRNLDIHTTSAVPQTDHFHATPNWGSNSRKRSPYKVLSTYTVNEHTFQKTNNSIKMIFLFGLMKYSNLLSELVGFC